MKALVHQAFAVRICLLFTTFGTLVLGACSQTSSPRDGAGTSARAAQTAGGAAGASSIDACRLLTGAEIQQQVGVAVDGGKLQTTATQASCDWTGNDGRREVGVGVSVKDFDQTLW